MKGTLYNPLYIRLHAGFSQWLRILNFEPSRPRDMPKMLTEFLIWLQDNDCHRPHDIQQEHLKRYIERLHERPSKTAAGAISLNYIRKHLQVIRKFSRYLTESGQESFTVKLRIKGKSSNVKCILTPAEISSLYEAVKDDTLGLRDKAILAFYYGCGLRKNEGANINVKDILLDKELVYVRKGKGDKERYVPLAGTGKADLENYILYGRPHLAADKKEDALLLNVNGTRLSGHMAYERLQKLKVIAKIKEPAGLHTLRHSIASHLLHSGMALEQIQRFLGHSSMESTQIYTHLQHEQKYKPSPETASALKAFETYLHNEPFGENYIRQNKNYAGAFLEWIAEQSLTPVQVTHADMMEFADQIKSSGSSIQRINQTMLAVRYYYAWLQHGGQATHNPAAGIILKGTMRNVPHDLLTKTELEALYESYVVTDNCTYRNKVMIGLLVSQALTRDELERLRPEHLKLREGKINVPAVGRQLSRILALKPHQILELHEHLLVVRPAILAERINERPGRKPGQYKNTQEISRLFISINSVESMKNILLHLNYALRKLNPKYKHAKQIRQSVITEWLKEKNMRTVQYMAGHRYVSSTERYKTTNLEDLKGALNKYHPLSL